MILVGCDFHPRYQQIANEVSPQTDEVYFRRA
jgi:hypothetical protein